jgi:hypothetical protein
VNEADQKSDLQDGSTPSLLFSIFVRSHDDDHHYNETGAVEGGYFIGSTPIAPTLPGRSLWWIQALRIRPLPSLVMVVRLFV